MRMQFALHPRAKQARVGAVPGSIYLGCGSADDETPLWQSMLHRSTTRIVYWPFALPGDVCATADDWLRGNLDRLGVGYRLDTWQSLDDHRTSDLNRDDVDLIFVGGGNTFRLLDHIRQRGFVAAVQGFWLAGGDYYGGSAGAVLACETIEIAVGHDPNEPGLEDLTALGLLAGASVLPHFTEDQLPAASQWAADHDAVVWGLPESAGLQCRDGRATVIGVGQLSRISGDSVQRVGSDDSLDYVAGAFP